MNLDFVTNDPVDSTRIPELELSDNERSSHSDSDDSFCSDDLSHTVSPTKQPASVSEVETETETSNSIGFSVQSLYTKRYFPDGVTQDLKIKDHVMRRQRLNTRPIDQDSKSDTEDESESEYDTAMFVPETGLVNGWFWHEYDSKAKKVREDRAILFQSQENYEQVMKHPPFQEFFEDFDYMSTPSFGEQVIVNGIKTSDLAIGDVFKVEGELSPLVVEITAPRLSCNHVNLRHGSESGTNGVKTYARAHCLAGWFARVIVGGELRDGMRLIKAENPNPKWTLPYITQALYCEGSRLQQMAGMASWNRDRAELEELISLPQLGEYEWKVEARKACLKLDGIDHKTVSVELLDPQAREKEGFDATKQTEGAPAFLPENKSNETQTLAPRRMQTFFTVEVFQLMILLCSVYTIAMAFLGGSETS